MSQAPKHTNRLAEASSPYLLQHAHNPVDWYPWGEEALQKAKAEDKPILVSIGYSACHWCHVMERESFENEEIAKLMNEHMVCIKVDREERPDVDAVYMDAVHAMGQQGGWPLNVFLMPNQKPFYGGTYFPPANWVQLISAIQKAYTEKREELEQQAAELTDHLGRSEVIRFKMEENSLQVSTEQLDAIFGHMAHEFDTTKGGTRRAPKFPMPSIWSFVLRYYRATHTHAALDQVILTLDRMAMGGIYDVVGGGFARYSVDDRWHVPHFEKMLYDNGQLLSLYADAYKATQKSLYRDVVYDTVSWLAREMTTADGGFYSALDADSEGVEGKFYIYTIDELYEVLDSEAVDFLKEHFGVKGIGNWEHGYNVLIRTEDDAALALKTGRPEAELREYMRGLWSKLFAYRSKRIRPGLDDKILTGWNGLMLKGLVDAYAAFGEAQFLKMALKNADFIESKLRSGNQLYRTYKDGKASLSAYLEDYAAVIEAYLALHQVTFEERWLRAAEELNHYVLEHFYDQEEGYFFFTDDTAEALITRKKELFDNVIPASNSIMAHNLFTLGVLLSSNRYSELASTLMGRIQELTMQHPRELSNWASLLTRYHRPTAEIVIVGPDAQAFRTEIQKHYLPFTLVVGSETESDLPLLEDRIAVGGKTTVYVCENRTCKLPVHSVEAALEQLHLNP